LLILYSPGLEMDHREKEGTRSSAAHTPGSRSGTPLDWYQASVEGEKLIDLGQYQDALSYLQRAREQAPGEAGTQWVEIGVELNIARCLLRLGKTDEGIQGLKNVLEECIW
jgi:hypothetical protein